MQNSSMYQNAALGQMLPNNAQSYDLSKARVLHQSQSPLGPMETAYQSCGPQIIPMSLGPPDKVVGSCFQVFPGRGVCLGSFPSQWVDVPAASTDCLFQENKVISSLDGLYQDPAGANEYGLSQRITPANATMLRDWSPCSSYGSYAPCGENCTGPCNGGPAILGTYAESKGRCESKPTHKYDAPFMKA